MEDNHNREIVTKPKKKKKEEKKDLIDAVIISARFAFSTLVTKQPEGRTHNTDNQLRLSFYSFLPILLFFSLSRLYLEK